MLLEWTNRGPLGPLQAWVQRLPFNHFHHPIFAHCCSFTAGSPPRRDRSLRLPLDCPPCESLPAPCHCCCTHNYPASPPTSCLRPWSNRLSAGSSLHPDQCDTLMWVHSLN